jgi:multiple sugar transport system permease protein
MDVVNEARLWLKAKPAKRTRRQQETLIGLLFLSPWLIGFVLLKALANLAALIFSVTDFQMLTPESTKFVGLENYVRFLGDSAAGPACLGRSVTFC